jgi:23S rRNA pseudouridine1911/1915/1917 synthase
MARIRVGEAHAGARIDHVVAASLPGISVNQARRLIAHGAVRVEGRLAHKGERLSPGQQIEIDIDAPADRATETTGSFDVEADPTLVVPWLHVDEALVAIDKPAGMPSHPLRAGERGTAANAIVARFPECAAASADAREGGLGHRLDTETSGVLLAARSREAWDKLRAVLGAPGCEKTYLAEVIGAPPQAGIATAPIGRVGRRGGRVRVGAGRQPLPARTEWEVIERRAGTALVRARLHAGRAHQVRAHLAAAGHPIVGDDVYGGESAEGSSPDVGAARLRLHAHTVSLAHPLTGASLLIEAPLPAWAILRA